MQHSYEVMHKIRLVIAWVQFLCKAKEWLWVVAEEIDVKYCRWFRQFVFRKIIIKTCARCPRNECRNQVLNKLASRNINWSINQSVNQAVNQSVNQSINQSINQLINHSSPHSLCKYIDNVITSPKHSKHWPKHSKYVHDIITKEINKLINK